MDIRFLSVEEVKEIHTAVIVRYGGRPGLRDRDLLESAVSQPSAAFGGQYLHRDLFAMAAAYFFHLIANHAFIDGNKRVGYASALTFLALNGRPIDRPDPGLYDAAMAVAVGRMSKEDVADLLRRLISGMTTELGH